jgi:uncharacterized membrane protein
MELFITENARLLVFFHVLSAMIWVGGMIVVRVAVHPALQKISDPKSRIPRTLQVMKRLFLFMIPVAFLLLLTALLMVLGFDYKRTDPGLHTLAVIKEAIWTAMSANLVVMLVLRKKAERAFYLGQDAVMARLLGLIGTYLLPLNILLGIVALYLGVMLRGF